MKKVILCISALLLIVSLFFMQTVFGERLLSYKDVAGFKIEETKKNGEVFLTFSGLVTHSALGVKSIKIEEKGQSLYISASLVLAGKSLSGNFSYNIKLPHEVNTVYFGEDKILVWNR